MISGILKNTFLQLKNTFLQFKKTRFYSWIKNKKHVFTVKTHMELKSVFNCDTLLLLFRRNGNKNGRNKKSQYKK